MSGRIGGRIGLVYLLGLYAASYLDTLGRLLFAAAFFLFGLLLFLRKKREMLWVAGTLAAAMLSFAVYQLTVIAPQRAFIGSTALVAGTVSECTYPDNDTVRLTVEGNADGIPIRVMLYTPDFGARPGDTVSFHAVFSELRKGADFSEADYSFSEGVFLRARAADDPVILKKTEISLLRLPKEFSVYLRERIGALLNGDEGGLIRAMFFGDRSGLSPALSVALKRAGLSHMTAVSGMHLSLIVHSTASVIGLFVKRRGFLRFGLIAGLIAVLMIFFGMTASVMRSGLMLLLCYGAEPLRRKAETTHTLGAAVLLITLFQPYACRDLGLWLSILGTLGTGALSPAVCRRVIRRPRFRRLKEAILSSVCAVVCTSPVSVLCFGGISLLSPIATLLVYPLFLSILLFMLALAASGGLLAEMLLLPAGLAAKAMIAVIRALGGLWFGFAELKGEAVPLLIGLTVIGVFLLIFWTFRFREAAKLVLLSVCVLMTASVSETVANWDNVRLTVYSDGSDALVLIESKSGLSALAASDSKRIGNELLEAAAGRKTAFLCVAGEKENNREGFALLDPIALHFPDDPDRVYHVNGEYTVTILDGIVTLEVYGVRFALLSAEESANADFAVIGGYRKNRSPSGAGREILCDKRYLPDPSGETANAYYEKIEITVRPDGAVLFRQGQS